LRRDSQSARSEGHAERLYLIAAIAILYATIKYGGASCTDVTATIYYWRRGISYLKSARWQGASQKDENCYVPTAFYCPDPQRFFIKRTERPISHDQIWFSASAHNALPSL